MPGVILEDLTESLNLYGRVYVTTHTDDSETCTTVYEREALVKRISMHYNPENSFQIKTVTRILKSGEHEVLTQGQIRRMYRDRQRALETAVARLED